MSNEMYRIHGTVTSTLTKAAMRDLQVEAWPQGVRSRTPLGKATTDEIGQFDIPILATKLQRVFRTGISQIYFRIYWAGTEIASTKDPVLWKKDFPDVEVTIPLEYSVIEGRISRPNGVPAIGLSVRAFDKTLRAGDKELTGDNGIPTDQDGFYRIYYSKAALGHRGKTRPDVFIRVYKGDDAIVGESPVIFRANPTERIDTVVNDLTEYDGLIEAFQPLLSSDNLKSLIEDGENKEISHLIQASGQDAEQVRQVVAAHKLHDVISKLPGGEEFYGTLSPEVIYGLLRSGQTADSLFISPDSARQAIENTAKRRIIAPGFEENEKIKAIVAQLHELAITKAVEEPRRHDGLATTNDLLSLIGLANKTKRQFFNLQLQQLQPYLSDSQEQPNGQPGSFWERLKAESNLEEKAAKQLRTAFALSELTGHFLPLIERLHAALEGDHSLVISEVRSVPMTQIQDVAHLTFDDWRQLVSPLLGELASQTHTGRNDNQEAKPDLDQLTEQHARNFANVITNIIEDRFPTAFVAHRAVELKDGDDEGLRTVAQFFKNLAKEPKEEFHLLSTSVPELLKKHPQLSEGIGDANPIEAFQYLYRLAPRFNQATALWRAGIRSSHDILGIDGQTFADRHGEILGGDIAAKRIYNRTKGVRDATTFLYSAGLPSPATRVTPEREPIRNARQPGDNTSPNLTRMFGPLDFCDCEHCRSWYSPAAYLVDQLKFLSKRPAFKAGARMVDEVLFERRPDLREIELSCENTNTRIPYVDLVNEILEDAVAPPDPSGFVAFPLKNELAYELERGQLSPGLTAAFQVKAIELDTSSMITPRGDHSRLEDNTPREWIIDTSAFSFTVRKDDKGLNVVCRSRQTRGTSESLSAHPQYLNPEAYKILGQAKFPWTLPFDLWTEEARLYLNHLGVQRYELMEVILFRTRQDTLKDYTVARDYLGLTPRQSELITGPIDKVAQNDDSWKLWGFPSAILGAGKNSIPNPNRQSRETRLVKGKWWESIRHVDVFLQQSGLAYRELLDLLDTYYVNPLAHGSRSIFISSPKQQNNARNRTIARNEVATCDISRMELVGPNGNPLDELSAVGLALRAVRFVRLWRVLGWSMRDLDRASRAFQSTAPDTPFQFSEKFLIWLFQLKRIQERTRLSVEQLTTWWSDLESRSYTDHEKNGQPRTKPLYERVFFDVQGPNTEEYTFPQYVSELGKLNRKTPDSLAILAAALGISTSDLDLLRVEPAVIPRLDNNDNASLDHNDKIDDKLNIENLSRLYRHASLVKTLRLRISDYISALSLIDNAPFANPLDTLRFIERVETVRSSGFSFAELDYLLRHKIGPDNSIVPTEDEIADFLEALRTDLYTIAEENQLRDGLLDLDGSLTSQKLGMLGERVAETEEQLGATGFTTRIATAQPWDATLIEQIIATLNGTNRYTTKVLELPQELTLPNTSTADGKRAELEGAITYHDEILSFTGVMTDARKGKLTAFANGIHDQQVRDGFRSAIAVLYEAPRSFIANALHYFAVYDFSVPIPTVGNNGNSPLTVPSELSSKAFVTGEGNKWRLHFVGPMSDQERTILLGAKIDNGLSQQDYEIAVDALFDPSNEFVPDFLGQGSVDGLFDKADPHERFAVVLKKLLPHLERRLSEQLLVSRISEQFETEARTAQQLLKARLPQGNAAVAAPQSCQDALLVSDFVTSAPESITDSSKFRNQFEAYLRLHKSTLIADRFDLSDRQLRWLMPTNKDSGWLNFEDIRSRKDMTQHTPALARSLFTGWERLSDLARVRDYIRGGERVLDALFKIAKDTPDKEDWLLTLYDETGWPLSTLKSLLGDPTQPAGKGLLDVTFPDDFQDDRLLDRLLTFFRLSKRLTLPPDDLASLARDDLSQSLAMMLRLATRAKYGEQQWYEIARPLRKGLREQQRAALVAYLVAHGLNGSKRSYPSGRPNDTSPLVRELQRKLKKAGYLPQEFILTDRFGDKTREAATNFLDGHHAAASDNGIIDERIWRALDAAAQNIRDANELYSHFLIDVEMDPCMETSRIKQANSTVQHFVQRCLMDLEADVLTGGELDSGWEEWKWRKNYRIWEANRKIFLYPENWIEPDLRDDKSPFFRELESELLQNDLNAKNAERAFESYLRKLDQVSHLEVLAMKQETEADAVGQTVDILHVFARTPTAPHRYFYRQRIDSEVWTAWEPIDLDIQSDHLIPVVWNRRLMLFWPEFIEQPPEDAQIASSWDIKLAWSERWQGRWLPKVTTIDGISVRRTNAGRYPKGEFLPESSCFTFRASVDLSSNLLIWFTFGTPEFFDALYAAEEFKNGFLFNGCLAEPTHIRIHCVPHDVLDTQTGIPETEKHSQTFVGPLADSNENSSSAGLRLPMRSGGHLRPVLTSIPGGWYAITPNLDYCIGNGTDLAYFPFFYRDQPRAFFVTSSEVRTPAPAQEGDFQIPDERLDPIPGSQFPLPVDQSSFWFNYDLTGARSDIGDRPVGPPTVPAVPVPAFSRPTVAGMTAASQPIVRMPTLRMVANPAGVLTTDMAYYSGTTGSDISNGPYENTDMTSESQCQILCPVDLAGMRSNPQSPLADIQPLIDRFSRRKTLYAFEPFYHPHVCLFVGALNRHGIEGLLKKRLQESPYDVDKDQGPMPRPLDFENDYKPKYSVPGTYPPLETSYVNELYPKDDLVDFSQNGPYALYNWELFFHAPLLIADSLMKNQRFEDAMRWFHFVFNPTSRSDVDDPSRYWITRPLADLYKSVDKSNSEPVDVNVTEMLNLLSKFDDQTTLSPEERTTIPRLLKVIEAWQKDPFKPHLIARFRRSAYAKNVVMKYLDNLVAWGDRLFRRDTMESINEAAQLYILAADILGPRPRQIPPRAAPRVYTYQDATDQLGPLSNFNARIEHVIPPNFVSAASTNSEAGSLALGDMLYFCVPENDKLLGYWDTIEDRLFKLRHCMNIEGVVRQLPLFAPPIDPALLVRAAHFGLDLDSVLNDLSAPTPHYRFSVMTQKATELCNELKSLGATLLSAMEKRDAEALALLRSEHETELLKRVEDVRKYQIEEADAQLQVLYASRQVAAVSYKYHQALLGEAQDIPAAPKSMDDSAQKVEALEGVGTETIDGAGMHMTSYEVDELENLRAAADLQAVINGLNMEASALHIPPDSISLTMGGSGPKWGPSHIARSYSAIAAAIKVISDEHAAQATRADRLGRHAMRENEWRQRAQSSAREIEHIDRQIIAAQIRKAIAEKERENHRKQIEEASKVKQTLKDKFTNKDLYRWMVGQVSTVYFQVYQLAYDVAKKAERAFQHELGITGSTYVQFGYWDSLKKGLLAGERLAHDIKRMEVAYLDKNRRGPELKAKFSLAMDAPLALLLLKQTGSCVVDIPESWYDIDAQQGHYMRRIRSVAVSIPCAVSGSYTSIHCTLSLLRSSVRHLNTLRDGEYARDREKDDRRFRDNYGGIESIVTSHAQEDTGLFEPNLRDERYLPFEGAGAISTWRIELPEAFRPFDYDTISDIVLHIRYTARLGGGQLKQKSVEELKALVSEQPLEHDLARLFSARHEFATEWYRFLHPKGDDPQVLTLDLAERRFPYLFRGHQKTITRIELFVAVSSDAVKTVNEQDLKLIILAQGQEVDRSGDRLPLSTWNGLLRHNPSQNNGGDLGKWSLLAELPNGKRLEAKALDDILLLCHYQLD